MSQSTSPTYVVLFGAGNVGTAVAILLRRSGYQIAGVGPLGRASTIRSAGLLGAEPCDPRQLPASDVVLLGVPDHQIEPASRAVAPHLADGTLVVHFAGALGTAPLDAVVASGGLPCALHPVQSCPSVDAALRRLPGSAWGVTCPPEARERAEQLVGDAGGHPIIVADGDRAIWHAAAATVANGCSALLATGEAMLAAIGVPKPQSVLGPLSVGTAANAIELDGAAAGLTGPVVRGDLATIERHIEALNVSAAGLVARYRAAALLTLEAAVGAGRLDPHKGEEVRALLERR